MNIKYSSIFTPLLVLGAKLGRHTAGIRITWGIIKTKTSGSFLEGFWVIKGQSHCDPHQDYCWCDALVVNVISKTIEVEINGSYNHIEHFIDSNDIITSINGPLHWQNGKHEANQLDGQQRHARFDYYEHNVPKFAPPG